MNALERAGCLAHADGAAFRRRVDEARALIAARPEHVVCVSWGKDSLVLYHLTGPGRRAVHGRYREEERFPDLDSVRDSFGPGPGYREVRVPGAWEMFEEAGGFFFAPETPEQRAASRRYHEGWARAMLGATGEKVLLGIRREESRNRARLVAMRGASYETKSQSVVLPLANWSGRDVWAYMALHGLPYPRIYDAAFSGRDRARSDFTFGAGAASEAIWRHGAWQDWKRAYPEQFARWTQRWPEMGALS